MTDEEATSIFRAACDLLRKISTGSHHEFYVASDSLCLMRGRSHDRDGRPQQQNIVAIDNTLRISGGDW